MSTKTNPTDALTAALERCQGIEAALASEQKTIKDADAELNSLQRTIDVSDLAQVRRMTELLTITEVGNPRRTYRHQEMENAEKALVAQCQSFVREALAPRLSDLALPSHREQSNMGLCASFMAELGGLPYMKEE
jgi:hypothetical protein